MAVRFKICCIASVEEAATAVRHGASAVGLVSAMPSGPGPIPEPLIAEIAPTVPPGAATFLLTCLDNPEAIIAQQRRCRANTLQLVDRLPAGGHRRLREALPGIGIVQVVHVNGPDAIDEARSVAADVDAILLDSGDQRLAVKLLGGTGRTHDWAVSRRIVEAVGVPVWLAGGLNPANVADAVRAVGPFGVDVCSGVRTDGRLDEAKLRAFVAALS
jgi:phosphoribosylanthranilate isomerase